MEITIKQYLQGKTGYEVDDLALQTIYIDRGIASGDTPISQVDEEKRDLVTADLYMWCATTPSSSASVAEKDGDWSYQRTGQKGDVWGKNRFVAMANELYKKWGAKSINGKIRLVSFGY